jgi:hypothetical protein
LLGAGAAFAAIPSAEEAPIANLQGAILAEMAGAGDDVDAVMAANTRATRGAPLANIVEAICPLPRTNLTTIYGDDAAAVAQAQGTLARAEVREGIAETCQVAQLALAS